MDSLETIVVFLLIKVVYFNIGKIKFFLRQLDRIIVLLMYLPLSSSVIYNAAFYKTTTQSSTLTYGSNYSFPWHSYLAVDGHKDSRSNYAITSSPLCSATDNAVMPAWWQVNLVSVHEIQQILIYGRTTDPPEQLRGFRLYISNTTAFKTNPNIVYVDATTSSAYNNNNGIIEIHSLNNNRFGRYVTIEMVQGITSLVLCEVEIFAEQNLIQRIKKSVYATMSSVWDDWTPYKAIDSVDNSDPNCDCCSGTNVGNAWWKLDLGSTYPIATIIFIGRSDNHWEQSKVNIYTNFTSMSQPGNILYAQDEDINSFRISYEPPIILRSIGITNVHIIQAITICELKLIESEYCPAGSYQEHCNSSCHCSDKKPCNRTDGVCKSPGCEPGWMGDSCNKRCVEGRFGENCRFPCHCVNDVCHHIDGSCQNGICAPGWKGYNCSLECDEGTFGYNCTSPCHCLDSTPCNHINGSCPGDLCAPGWKRKNCSVECDEGNFGYNCSSPCHCLDNTSCYHINGSCPGNLYAPGWKSDNCSIECDEGTFGHNCTPPCHCLNNKPCNHINGSCPNNLCATGWKSNNCSIACDEGRFGQNCASICHCLNDKTCDHIDGSCPGNLCAPGWKSRNCSIECDEGNFGQNCSSPCHCLNDIACDHINGSCPGNLCAPGWMSDNCSIACDKGSFGQNCTSPCHCLNDKTCDHIDGSCPGNLFAPGWKSRNCSIEIMKSTNADNTVVFALGGMLGLAILLNIITIVLLLQKKKLVLCKSSSPKNESLDMQNHSTYEDLTVNQDATQHYETIRSNNLANLPPVAVVDNTPCAGEENSYVNNAM